jgi:hypothetical protein
MIWFVLIYALIILAASNVKKPFRREILLGSTWYNRVTEGQKRRFKVAMVWTLIILFPPIRWYFKFLRNKEWQAEQMQAAEKAEKENERKTKHWEEENKRREAAREQWLLEHRGKLGLYYNTIAGVTAVLRPTDYRQVEARTNAARLDEEWDAASVLMPATNTCLFVTAPGKKIVEGCAGTENARDLVAGMYSVLRALCDEYDVQLVHKADIFVPFVNETLVPFEEQYRGVVRGRATSTFLLEAQAPEELQYLPRP